MLRVCLLSHQAMKFKYLLCALTHIQADAGKLQ